MDINIFSDEQIFEMRRLCHIHEYDSRCEYNAFSDVLWEGCVGWANMEEEQLIWYFKENLPDEHKKMIKG